MRRVLQTLLDLRLIGDVERAGPDAIAGAAKRLGNALGGFAVPVGDRNRGSLLAESARRRLADPAAGAGDEGAPAFQQARHAPGSISPSVAPHLGILVHTDEDPAEHS